jgi:hypothetical protein
MCVVSFGYGCWKSAAGPGRFAALNAHVKIAIHATTTMVITIEKKIG